MPTPTSEENLQIVYQDSHYVAINKPPGLLVHRTNIDFHEKRFALQLLRDQLGRQVHPVHRLDKATSGILIFALNEESLRLLKLKFESGEMRKEYQAIVRGFSPDEGTINQPLKRPKDTRRDSDSIDYQEAQTNFETLSGVELPLPTNKHETTRYSHLLLKPKTGRWHQLRRHLASINHPIIGDTTHGDNKQNRLFLERYGFRRLWLAATRLSFENPMTREWLDIKVEPWADFEKALQVTGLSK